MAAPQLSQVRTTSSMWGLCRSSCGGEPQLGGAADAAAGVASLADPDRQRRSPVAGPREVPVDEVLQPVAHPAVADVLGLPVDAPVVLDQPLLHRRGPDEPGGERVVEQRGVAAPAEGIGVADLARLVEPALGLEVGDDPRVGVLDEETAIAGLPLEEAPVEADHVADRDPLPAAQLQVGLAVGGRGVDDPGPLLHRNQPGSRQHQEGPALGEHVGEERLVGAADQVASAAARR